MSESPSLELVIARYAEEVSWLNNVPNAYRVSVYNKGDDMPGAVALPNAGREAHTYLHHIIERYERLADITVFCQGKPFDHVPDLHSFLKGLAAGTESVETFKWLGFIIDCDDGAGRLFKTWGKNENGRGLRLADFYRELFETPPPEAFTFFPSAHFAVTAAQVTSRSVTFYKRALERSMRFPDAAHCFERVWDRVFNADGIPPAARAMDMPIYLRPVERLGITWETARANRSAVFGNG